MLFLRVEAFELAFDMTTSLSGFSHRKTSFTGSGSLRRILVFENVHDVKFDLEPFEGVEIADLRREDPHPRDMRSLLAETQNGSG